MKYIISKSNYEKLIEKYLFSNFEIIFKQNYGSDVFYVKNNGLTILSIVDYDTLYFNEEVYGELNMLLDIPSRFDFLAYIVKWVNSKVNEGFFSPKIKITYSDIRTTISMRGI